MKKRYKIETTVSYSALMVIEADSPEDAEQIALDSCPSWVLTDQGDELDFLESVAYAVEEDEG